MRGVDIAGVRYGKLVAIERIEKSKNSTWKWRVRCDCGAEEVIFMTALRGGKKESCRTCWRLATGDKQRTHGMTNTPTYRSWQSMHSRCGNPDNPDWDLYGGRGITVCERWSSFENFLEDMGIRPAKKTLDRRNNNDNYEPSNCRWATDKEQANNRRPRNWCKGGVSTVEEAA